MRARRCGCRRRARVREGICPRRAALGARRRRAQLDGADDTNDPQMQSVRSGCNAELLSLGMLSGVSQRRGALHRHHLGRPKPLRRARRGAQRPTRRQRTTRFGKWRTSCGATPAPRSSVGRRRYPDGHRLRTNTKMESYFGRWHLTIDGCIIFKRPLADAAAGGKGLAANQFFRVFDGDGNFTADGGARASRCRPCRRRPSRRPPSRRRPPRRPFRPSTSGSSRCAQRRASQRSPPTRSAAARAGPIPFFVA